MITRKLSVLGPVLGIVAVIGIGNSHAAVFPANVCVASKQKQTGIYCKRTLKAWAVWDKDQDDTKRNTKIQRAKDKLDLTWGKAEDKSSNKGSDCTAHALTSGEAATFIDAEVSSIVADINSGLDLVGSPDDATCGRRLLTAAARKCDKFLKAEGIHLKRLARDPAGTQRANKQDLASQKFSDAWDAAGSCPTDATKEGIEASVDALTRDVVLKTVVAANLDDTQFTTFSPTGTTEYQGRQFSPTCIAGTDYHYFAKRGSVNKLVMYYQGGGACWEQLTCSIPVCDDNVNPSGGDNPNNVSSGFADLTNPSNPFKDWNIVFVSYCSCDIHFGDAAQDYANANPGSPIHIEHRGYHNAKVVEKFAREHFLNPDVVFVTGSSAGAYGALFHAPLLHEVWPASQFHVLADAGNGVITQSFLQEEFANWNFTANLPPDIPGVLESITENTGMVGYIQAVSNFFDATNWAHYTTAFDGGTGGQTGFYNVMLNDNNPLHALTWWEGSCAFNSAMRQQALDTVPLTPGNYRYYIGTGSRHTMYGGDKVYTDTTGGVPTIVDWVKAMLASAPNAPDPGWTNVEASPFNVLLKGECSAGSDNPGDPCALDSECPNGTCVGEDVHPPSIPTAPFEFSGSDIVVNCGSPSGAFLDASFAALD